MNSRHQYGPLSVLVLGLCLLSLHSGSLRCLTAAETPVDDPLRLDPRIRPITQSLELRLDPTADDYSGSARIELQFSVATNRFCFHASEIGLGKATVDGRSLTLKTEEAGIVSAAAGEPLAAGFHVFEVAFTNDFSRDGRGLFKVEAEGKPYLFTMMAPADARRAFPCWDEPGFKIPWRVTLTIPSDLEAVGNLPVAVTTPAGKQKILEFGRTPPMPSYLVALAVGAFEFTSIPGQSVPGRIVTIGGKSAQAQSAAQEIPHLLTALEQYFGVPQPFPKLDHVAVPDLFGGAMENAGAIFYSSPTLLLDQADSSALQKNSMIDIVTHELSHMWFGNLVTMGWWDDVWLSEGFATWMSLKIVGRVHPEVRTDLIRFQSAEASRVNDAQPTVKAVRRPFRGGDDLTDAYDTLSYSKGQSILSMIEGWIGEAKFREALRQYFARHGWGTTRAEDLWAAFSETGDDSLRETARRYIEQPGIPELSIRRLSGDRLQVRQRRYRSLAAKALEEGVWWVPMVLRHGGPMGTNTVRLFLTKEEQVFDIPGLDRAAWIHPNSEESGYYYWNLDPDLTAALTGPAKPPLSAAEKLGLLDGARAAMRSGNLPAEQVLQLAFESMRDAEPQVRAASVAAVERIRRLVASEDQAAYTKLVGRRLRSALDDLGFDPKPGDSAEVELLRYQLLSQLGFDCHDPEVLGFCRDSAERQLADPRSVSASSAASVTLGVTTWHGDAAWAARLRSAFEQAKDPEIRSRFALLLADFRDPVLVRSALDYGLTEMVKPTELSGLFFGRADLDAVRFEWLVTNYEAVKRRLPARDLPFLVFIVNGGDQALLEKGRAFFLDPARKDAPTEKRFAEVAELVEGWAVLRARHGAGLAAFIQARKTETP